MKRAWLDVLVCPRCRARFTLDATRVAEDEVVEAFLVCRECLEAWPVVGGSAILPRDLGRHLAEQGTVYHRTPIADPRLVRHVLGRLGDGADVVPFEEVTARYGDLAADPADRRPRAPEEIALERALDAAPGASGRALEVGCGVGRGTFLLAERGYDAFGVDRSAARIRRARGLAVTDVGFRVRAPDEPDREVELDLDRLARADVDFGVADPEALPFADATFDLVVVRGTAPEAEPRRVAKPGGSVLRVDGGP